MSKHLPVLDTSMPFGWIGGPSVHQLHITLLDTTPVIWRRVVLPSGMLLGRAARMLEAAMGWQGYHLHSFEVGHLRFGDPDEDDESLIDESGVNIAQLWPQVGDAVSWSYDFGDGWQHNVVLEAIAGLDGGDEYPLCLGGERACPPEDCGGPWGYSHLVEALADPIHDEHEQLSEWVPEGFDSAFFDADEVTQLLRGIK